MANNTWIQQYNLANKIGLTGSDIQEFKDTWSYSQSAQDKINAYKANMNTTAGTSPVTNTTIATPTVWQINAWINTNTWATTWGMQSPKEEAKAVTARATNQAKTQTWNTWTTTTSAP